MLMFRNKRVLSFPAMQEFNMNMPLIKPQDLVIIVSLSGETESIKENVEMLKSRNIPVLSITNLNRNFLAQQADFSLYYVASPFSYREQSNDEVYSLISLRLVIDTLIRKYFESRS